ncbi:hypothetical protein JL475_21230 [Streptomyces sp. M2CJ-2]|uniref:hypothetical protein n=1 Tax=Streptomyces sp. M2CJ-2 TaxID=2803948 RepID=UPI001926F57E|nr:hypothetical protein [Streptomyces sp. M2CJ-2]MBL3668470.1 hypothetical protein [Streptomyces sp. M2CJ-2]
MNPVSAATAGAAVFVWLGMVLAISFLEAPLKFRAPGVTIPVGLGIGRIVFRALNLVELVLVATTLVAVAAGGAGTSVVLLAVVVAAVPAAQLGVIRPRLNRRSDRVLAGERLSRSHAHWYYVAFEAVKAVALLVLGILLLAA